MNGLCDDCHMRPATVQMQQITNNVKVEKSLCQVCVQRYTGFAGPPQMPTPMQIMQMMPQMMQMMPQMMQMMPQVMQMMQGQQGPQPPAMQVPPVSGGLAHLRCGRCGHSFGHFQQSGLLGCPECYRSFAPQMQTVLRRAQGGAVQHHGKVPSRWDGKLRVDRQVESLRGQLEEAVQQERFEDAARLRDEIRRLQSQVSPEEGP